MRPHPAKRRGHAAATSATAPSAPRSASLSQNEWNQHQPSRLREIMDPGRRAGSQSTNQRSLVAKPAAGSNSECVKMATQIVMDRTGDTRHTFDIHDRAEVEKAERRFKELTGAGFTAAVRSGPGEQRIIRSFDPTAEETLFYPRLVGG